jgi:hypothetical protein
MSKQLSVFADLSIDMEGRQTTLKGDGQTVVWQLSQASDLNRHAPKDGRPTRTLSILGDLLDGTGMRLQVAGKRGTFLEIGDGVRANAAGRLLGPKNCRVKTFKFLFG